MKAFLPRWGLGTKLESNWLTISLDKGKGLELEASWARRGGEATQREIGVQGLGEAQ